MKNKKVTMLIDFGSAYNLINCELAKLVNCFIYLATKFQVMVVP
jgi:hypothetical protein